MGKLTTLRLHTERVQSWIGLSRVHIVVHLMVVLLLFYYRLFRDSMTPTLAWILMTTAELILAMLWFFNQAFRWRPVSRSVIIHNLPKDEKLLPGLDIFVCTLDPLKEPTLDVMETVISAIAMDYPSDNLSVYLSDDGACPVTLYAVKEASLFAKAWLPFCKKYGIKSTCPKVFFSASPTDHDQDQDQHQFRADQLQIKAKYEKMQKNIEKFGSDIKNGTIVTDRPPRIEIIIEEPGMPRLVYVSRERRPSLPHKFKGGALNTLLRVSGLMSNGAYVLVLDCDMYCNDPSSAKQAMCFFLDPESYKHIAFVQFPQMFHNLSKKDIYDSQARTAFKTMWQGMDGLRGPGLSGSGNYLNRRALLFGSPNQKDDYLADAEKYFGKSSMYIESLKSIRGEKSAKRSYSKDEILREAGVVASCSYENNTEWGAEVGFSYGILLESTITGYLLHCRGWRSAYLYPKRPCFLGCAPTDIKEGMLQLVKWLSELCLLAVSSKYSPFTYGFSTIPSILHNFTYCFITLSSFYAFVFILYGIVPQICFFKGIPVFPNLTDPWFAVFAILFLSTQIQHLIEVLSGDGSVAMWWDEQRIWILKSVTSIFAVIDGAKKWLGLRKRVKFNLSNKAIDKEKLKKYEEGKFDFQGAAMYMSPMVLLLIVNIVCFFGGIWRLFKVKDFQDMFGQLFLVTYVMLLSYPLIQGIITSINTNTKTA